MEREYTIVAPDGRELTITGPANASPQQLRAAAEAAFKAAAQPAGNAAADETGRLGALAISAGRSTDKVIQGVRQLYNKAIGDDATLAKMAETEAENDRLYKPLREKFPIVTAVGEAAPALVTPIGSGSALSMLGKAAIGGAAPGLLSYGSAEERLKSGAVGALGNVAGTGIGLGVGKLLRPASATAGLSDEAAGAAQRLGVQLSAGQKTGNPSLINFENYLAKSPGSSGAMLARSEANQTALNTAAARSMGQKANNLGEDVFSAAKDAIGSEFQRLQSITQPQLGNDFLNTLAQIDSANAAKGAFKSKEIDGLINKGLDLATQGKLSGTAYKEIRTELSNEAQRAFKGGDATLGQAYKALRRALDDAAEQSLSAADRKAWGQTRAQWQAYKTLTKSNVAEAGNVSAPRVAAAVRQSQGDALRTGAASGDLADIARVGEAIKGSQNPNSGQLAQMQMMAMNPTMAGVAILGGNKAAQTLYTNPLIQKYLAEGLIKVGPNGRLILAKAAAPAGLPLVQQYLGAQ